MTDEELKGIRERAEARCEARMRAEAGKPLARAPIEYDWNDRGNFTRRYAHSIVTFAMRAFRLGEQLEETNGALEELCRTYLEHPDDMYEAHSFHWSGALYIRLWQFFSARGSMHPGRMNREAETAMLEMMWAWLKKASPQLDPEIGEDRTWRTANSENHHAMGTVTCWGFAKALKEREDYRDRTCEDGRTPKEHFDAWTTYYKTYFQERVKKSLSVEIASKSYNSHTIQMWYTLYDFAEDATLKRRAGQYLDLYWATWAEEQLDGVRGGGKTRIYQGPASRSSAGDAIRKLAGLHLGFDDKSPLGAPEWSVATSTYRMPLPVMRIALDTGKRGAFEVRQRYTGLAEPGYEKAPGSGVTFFGVTGYRRDYGGILRTSTMTPDFVIGTLMVEPRALKEWTGAGAQNRWHGVIFRGHPDACIVPECEAIDRHLNLNFHGVTMNQQWSVQKKGTLIAQKLPAPEFSRQAGDMRVWFAAPGLSEPVEEGGWIFVEAEGAFASVHAARGGFTWEKEEGGRWMRLEEDLSPVVIETARRKEHGDFAAFRRAVTSRPPTFEGEVLRWRGLSGDDLTFYADRRQVPEVNGTPVDFAPPKVLDSPFVQSAWDSGVVTITDGQETLVLDFNAEEGETGRRGLVP